MVFFHKHLARIWLVIMTVYVGVSICDLKWHNGTGGGYKWAKNCEFVGANQTKMISSTKLECGGKCYDDPECTHFSWNAGNCYLKRFDNQPMASDLDSIFCGWMSGGRFQPQITGNLVHSDFKWQDGIGGIKWAQACKFSGPEESKLKTISASLPILCIDACITLTECTHFNWDSGNCYLKHLDYAVPAYNFDGSPCGWVNRSEPRQKNHGEIPYFQKHTSLPSSTEFVWLDGNGGKVKWSMDCDFYGSDIAGIPGPGEACGLNCVNNGNCTHFTWSHGTCFLKHFYDSDKLIPTATRLVGNVCGWVTNRSPDQQQQINNNEDNVSSEISDFEWQNGIGGGFKWATKCDFFGSDILTVPSKKDDCGGICYDNPECTHFTWNEDNCIQKHFKIEPSADDLNLLACGWVSGRGYHPQIFGNTFEKSHFKWQEDVGGLKWAKACQFYGPDGSGLKTIESTTIDECGSSCALLTVCTNFNWVVDTCYLKHFDTKVAFPAYIFTDSICGLVNRSEPRQTTPDLKGKVTNNWDCCKPSCSWSSSGLTRPVNTCAKNGITVLTNKNAASGCDGGTSFICNNQAPWAINTSLAYGFASFHRPFDESSGSSSCCKCYKLSFTSGQVAGKTMIVQVINVDDGLEEGDIALKIPGGRMPASNGCSSQWGAPSESGWVKDENGVKSIDECDKLPSPLQEGCKWRFNWLNNADNLEVTYKDVVCPMELFQRTLCRI